VEEIVFHGRGLHSGEQCAVALTRRPGPLCFETRKGQATREQLEVIRADHGVCVRAKGLGLEVDLIEHLFAAFGGLGVQQGIRIQVLRGREIPLLDGAALEFAAAVKALAPPRSAPRLRVVRAGEVVVGESSYTFGPADSVRVAVRVQFPGREVEHASWDGSAAGFFREIATARTFGFRRDVAMLRARGRAAHVDVNSVLVLEEDGSIAKATSPARPGELARHKMLDLIGDLFLYGGPLLGALTADRPGHARTHDAVRRALSQGLVQRV
jgi:UDP-3-O-[3-hydroxymyristoyl] N-acetylglucosamine deacetylase